GIIGAAGKTEPGIATSVRFVSVRVLDATGAGRASDVIRGIDWVIGHRQSLGIRVLNISLGHPIAESWRTDPVSRAVTRAWRAGLLVVVSAGNLGRLGSGFGTITSPGNTPSALTVGAFNDRNTGGRQDDIETTYSSRGPSFLDHV